MSLPALSRQPRPPHHSLHRPMRSLSKGLSLRTFQHTPNSNPARFSLDIDIAEVEIRAEKRRDITVTLTPANKADTVAEDLITRAEASTTRDGEFVVRVPRPVGTNGGTTVIHSGGSVTVSSRNVARGNVIIGSQNGVTIVNGRVISGSGMTVVGPTGGDIHATVAVPVDAAVTVHTVAADVTTHGQLGCVSYQSVSGDIDVEDTTRIEAKTTSGDVTVDRTVEAFVTTVSGDLVIRDLGHQVTARSVSGDITVHATADSTVHAKAVSGDVQVTHVAGAHVDAQLASVSGRVRGPQAKRGR